MPNAKRDRRPRARAKARRRERPSGAEWFWREVIPALRREWPVARRSRRHLRNAAIEVLEAMRAMLDETIEWLRRDKPRTPELKRIRVEG